jgi:type II secretory pathway pseudopilin PulG
MNTHPTRAPRAPRPSGERGMSMLELIVASSMLLIVIGAAMHVMITGQKAYNYQSSLTECQERTRRFLELFSRDIAAADGSTLSISDEHTILEFRVPVDTSGTGNVLGADGKTIQFGAPIGAQGYLGYRIRYRFDWNTGKMPCEICERIDYNNDGQVNYYFRQGRIVREILNTTGLVMPGTSKGVISDVFVRYYPKDGDVNGDLKTDPLFMRISGYTNGVPIEDTVGGNQLLVNVWVGRLAADKRPVLAGGKTAFRLVNVQ